jgi:hypothetical protein
VNLNGRVLKLEAVEAALGPLPPDLLPATREALGLPEGFDLDAELHRWNGLLCETADLVDDEAANDALATYVARRFVRLEGLANPEAPPAPWPGLAEEIAELRRVPKALLTFFRTVPADLRAGCVPGLADVNFGGADGWRGWLAFWLKKAAELWCRLPPDVDAGAMRQAVAFYVPDPPRLLCLSRPSCDSCGLLFPARYGGRESDCLPPAFLKGCPGCGHGGRAWHTRPGDTAFAWRDLARCELAPETA